MVILSMSSVIVVQNNLIMLLKHPDSNQNPQRVNSQMEGGMNGQPAHHNQDSQPAAVFKFLITEPQLAALVGQCPVSHVRQLRAASSQPPSLQASQPPRLPHPAQTPSLPIPPSPP